MHFLIAPISYIFTRDKLDNTFYVPYNWNLTLIHNLILFQGKVNPTRCEALMMVCAQVDITSFY